MIIRLDLVIQNEDGSKKTLIFEDNQWFLPSNLWPREMKLATEFGGYIQAFNKNIIATRKGIKKESND